ncbi:uncharacterized mitochondrial protein AtMg00820-like [Solanum dulcamara]|uniref:uncharacterized mitochondrial protein AtMg00820-like n=1 Tax=Solanum dulcamara TaxID=45834 RepID=UPI0024868012|nr:uncharacterized mitochondrial protein AtMg00820-like [Solanum dulcamara]
MSPIFPVLDLLSSDVHIGNSDSPISEVYPPISMVSDTTTPKLSMPHLSDLSPLMPDARREASLDPRWVEAMQLQIASLEDNHTWSVVDLPPNKSPIGCKWIFKVKYKASGEVGRFKARLVTKRFSQKEGVDYTKTFSLVSKIVAVRSIITLAASKDWFL